MVAVTKGVFEEEGGAGTLDLTMGDDRYPFTQKVCLIHVVSGEEDGSTWGGGRIIKGVQEYGLSITFQERRMVRFRVVEV